MKDARRMAGSAGWVIAALGVAVAILPWTAEAHHRLPIERKAEA